ISRIVSAVRMTLDRCPPELAGDLVSRGIVLTGGGALLRGLDARLQHEIGIPVLVADRPLDSVVLGTATVVEHFEQLHRVVGDGHRRYPGVRGWGGRHSERRSRARTRASPPRPARLTQRQRVAALTLAVLAAGFIALDLGGGSLQSAHGGVRGLLGS